MPCSSMWTLLTELAWAVVWFAGRKHSGHGPGIVTVVQASKMHQQVPTLLQNLHLSFPGIQSYLTHTFIRTEDAMKQSD